MFGDYTLATDSAMVNHWKAYFDTLDQHIGDAAFQVVDRPSVLDRLAGCTVPLLAVAGAEDHAYPSPVSNDDIAKAAENGVSAVMDRVGHSPLLEDPETAAALLMEHFARAT